ncbi:helix-turn-helix domain-containing GNAT family N-acetyltransferase [Sphingobium sp. V4]|uniref:bifunctional helix-turn-helix transcriptional regulator/GNAT family N-acetyltransferase n=1 Tax=Sphingobium sp. V4 TaxID=3038927 RepID=UPI0025580E54|nr:helix-turn-helix domain-containing GNAT family N-acetyltransferase [Sphingobium sp. V4]WIW87260.1 helix-turn-helix domain-containing GNAT family N-acetyltransferase [Sphingobium sp. V4]
MSGGKDDEVDQLRSFNRTYTTHLGLLETHLANSRFTLSEGRILYELAHRQEPTAAEIGRTLRLDRSQISRTLKRFAEQGLIISREDPAHGRNQLLSLTAKGRAAFDKADQGARDSVAALLDALPLSRRAELLRAVSSIKEVLEAKTAPDLIVRELRTGDLGLIVHRQAVLYAAEYGYDGSYETLIAQILADFHRTFDPHHEAGWVAEWDGKMAGSIFLMRSEEQAIGKLRLLYVEPDARGVGVGRQLVEACIARARTAGYRQLELWTDSQLTSARRLYARAGFKLRDTKVERHFGQDIGSETWAMAL